MQFLVEEILLTFCRLKYFDDFTLLSYNLEKFD